ncbi:putative nucleic acid-binding Zn-ribbon protein [Devosia subaequoris]|uniref:Putative nucleic acid-binding Zn-ribbon protein n=1 Tax=Devosia subaequoris TaxID=395930 RepID=A0A7W6IMR6_9HYPH|nr:hypothetical protein [Devosia subaequoris]MBB4051951.1 putative nucleic acid-binding Zn-ribbon protein [Devosia subaequoris]MCP1210117.1 hypothetical protein [Devosia subaequoris]
MKKTFIATAVTALLASTAIAQDANVGVDAGGGASVETPSLDAGASTDTSVDAGVDTDAGAKGKASANAGANANANANANASDMADNTYGSVMASIKGSADLDLSSITDESKISIVLLSSLQGDAATESAALDAELTTNADAQAGLHSRIEGNTAITAKLEAEGHAVEDVVSVKTKADGSVIVYVDDRD